MVTEYKLLDHGYVKHVDHMGTEESIIEAARMSTGKGFEGWDKDERLLTYLYSHKHMSPFEMCELVVEVQAPIFVVREWQRHRTFSYNEFSARYSKMLPLDYLPAITRFETQSIINKQSGGTPMPHIPAQKLQADMRYQQDELYRTYEHWLNMGLARELARINTPVSRYTKMRAKGNLRNWLQFLDLRMRENAQYEIRVYAQAIAELIHDLFPRSYDLFLEHTLYAVTVPRTRAKEMGL